MCSLKRHIDYWNAIQELPVTVGKLKMLTNFNADKNRLTEIPKEVCFFHCCSLKITQIIKIFVLNFLLLKASGFLAESETKYTKGFRNKPGDNKICMLK